MTARTEHEAIRERLALFVAEALETSEQRQIELHLAACAACAAELDAWRELVGSLRCLPTPQAPAGVVERVRVQLEAQLAEETERKWNQKVMLFLVLFAWAMTLVSWPIVRLLTRGVAGWLDLPFPRAWMDLAWYTVLVWLTAGIAAAVLGWRRSRERRLA